MLTQNCDQRGLEPARQLSRRVSSGNLSSFNIGADQDPQPSSIRGPPRRRASLGAWRGNAGRRAPGKWREGPAQRPRLPPQSAAAAFPALGIALPPCGDGPARANAPTPKLAEGKGLSAFCSSPWGRGGRGYPNQALRKEGGEAAYLRILFHSPNYTFL